MRIAGNFFGTTVSTQFYFILILRLEVRMRDEGKSSFDALPFIELITTTFVRTTPRLVRTPASYSGDRWLKSGRQFAVVIFSVSSGKYRSRNSLRLLHDH